MNLFADINFLQEYIQEAEFLWVGPARFVLIFEHVANV